MSLQEAILQQKIGFLESELEESKKREQNLKHLNDSLMEAMYSEDSSEEIKHLKDLLNQKQRKIDQYETENQELKMDLREITAKSDSNKYELINEIQKLKAENESIRNNLQSQEETSRHAQSVAQYQFHIKLRQTKRELLVQKEENKKECNRIKQESEAAIIELKSLFGKENEALRQQVRSLQNKVRQQASKIQELEDSEVKIQDLQDQLKNRGSLLDESEVKSTARRDSSNYLQVALKAKATEIKELKQRNENLRVQKNKLQNELERLKEVKENEPEVGLKTEIKGLIDKLLQAKTKLVLEGEKAPRPKSVTKNRLSQQVPRSISPLNLSYVSRAQTPQEALSELNIH